MVKVRDLQNSYKYRVLLNKSEIPSNYSRRRVITASSRSAEISKRIFFDGNEFIQNCSNKSKPSSAISSSTKQDLDGKVEKAFKEHFDSKIWLDNRKKMRNDLENLGFNKSWFYNKPKKSVSEKRVYRKNQKEAVVARERDKLTSFLACSKIPRVSAAHVNCLPLLNSPLPIALAIIADYLQDHRLKFLDLFTSFYKNKDWLMMRDDLKHALKNIAIPLNDAQLDKIIILLDVDHDSNLSLRELAVRIEAYHHDKRWKRLKDIYDNIVDDYESKKSIVSDRMDLELQLLNIRDDSVENHYHRYQERMLRKNTLADLEKKEIVSTREGNTSKHKLMYVEELNEECKKLFSSLKNDGVLTSYDTLKRAIIPPLDHTKIRCQNYLTCDRGSFPKNHPMCREHRRKQQRLKKSNADNNIDGINISKLPTSKIKVALLPRVAGIDYKSRTKEGRRARVERQNTSPNACWPHQLLDKIRLCDDGKFHDGKSVLFNYVKS